MNRRLYYLFPDVAHTQKIVDELLIKRIDIKHIYVLAREDTDLKDLPEAKLTQKHDIGHSLFVGAIAGGVFGIVVGIIAHNVLGVALGGVILGCALGGAALGAWASSMVGMMTTNVHIRPFQDAIDHGQILLFTDVPKERVDEIEEMVYKIHPEAKFKGVDAIKPSFP